MTGIELIASERERQVYKGWTKEHDKKHVNGEIAAAASAYCLLACDQVYPERYKSFEEIFRDRRNEGWPWDNNSWHPDDDPIFNLVKAGALIAAEIDRLLDI